MRAWCDGHELVYRYTPGYERVALDDGYGAWVDVATGEVYGSDPRELEVVECVTCGRTWVPDFTRERYAYWCDPSPASDAWRRDAWMRDGLA